MYKKILITLPLLASVLTMNGLAQNKQTLEPLYGIHFEGNTLHIKVKSYGCTQQDHFTLKTQHHTDYTQLSIMRNKADQCRAMPRIISLPLVITDDVSQTPYKIENLFVKQ